MLWGMMAGEFVGMEFIFTLIPVLGPFENLLSSENITKSARHRHNTGSLRMPWGDRNSVVVEPCKIDVGWTLMFTTERNCVLFLVISRSQAIMSFSEAERGDPLESTSQLKRSILRKGTQKAQNNYRLQLSHPHRALKSKSQIFGYNPAHRTWFSGFWYFF